MKEYVVNGIIYQGVSVVVEAKNETEALSLARELINNDECMYGDAELDKDSLEIEEN